MSSAPKLLFDECCSRRLPRELLDFYRVDYPALELRHVLDAYKPGTTDPKWLEPLRKDKTWIAVTKDAGKHSPDHKLPHICRAWKITHVTFTPALIQAGFTAQKNALVAVWPQIMRLGELPPGTRVRLGFGRARGGIQTFDLRVDSKPLLALLSTPPAKLMP